MKKIIALIIAISALAANTAFAAEATRGYTADYLLRSANFYNPTVKRSDIIQGYEDGQLHEGESVTRAETLVMLKRAFGNLPPLTGQNKRAAIPMDSFSDIPLWAESELGDIFNAGIAAGTSDGIFSPDEPVTTEQLELFTKRVFSLFGTNEKDDFYAAVNKDALNTLEIKPGRINAGSMYDLNDKVTEQINEIIKDIASKTHKKGSTEQKICDFYNSILDKESRNKIGIEPIQKYLDLIDGAKTIQDLMRAQAVMADEIIMLPFMSFSLETDFKDSTKNIICFSTGLPRFNKNFYEKENPNQVNAYIKLLQKFLVLSGEENADAMARKCFELEKKWALSGLNPEDSFNVDKIYNLFTMQEIKDMLPMSDLDTVFEAGGFRADDKIMIKDTEQTKEFANTFNDDNLDALKAYAKTGIFLGRGRFLSQEVCDIQNEFNRDFYGIDGEYTDEETAVNTLKNFMPEYIGKLYVEKYFSEKAKKDVERMIRDIISVYRERLENNEWLSDTTKEKAINKLDKMGIKIGYPNSWKSCLDNADIKSSKDGRSYFENVMSILRARKQESIEKQYKSVDKTEWEMYPFEANACYSFTSNDITFPAAILQAPFYDVNASYEQNLGGIGYVIAHEISHAFDADGAKFDENGNASDWWSEKDYKEFQILCEKMVDFYDGCEEFPGIGMNGTLTLSENIADQGAVACITEITSRLENPDFKTLYKSMASCWASASTRGAAEEWAQTDCHSADKVRINRTVVNCDEFYNAFEIDENDGMYVAPENRVKIW